MIYNNMNRKLKTILFASLIAAMILPFSGMDFAEAKDNARTQQEFDERFAQVNNVYDNDQLNQVTEIISALGISETIKTKENGDVITTETNVSNHGTDSFKVISISNAITNEGQNHETGVTYFVTPSEDGSLYIHVPDARPSADSNIDGSNGLEFTLRAETPSLIPEADATTGTLKYTMSVNKSISNNFVSGNANFVQNCGLLPSTTASMYGAADATTVGSYWRAVNANMGGAYWYSDWCILPNTYDGVDFEMGGTGYNDHNWTTTWAYPGWGPTGGLQFPVDNIHFKTNAYYS